MSGWTCSTSYPDDRCRLSIPDHDVAFFAVGEADPPELDRLRRSVRAVAAPRAEQPQRSAAAGARHAGGVAGGCPRFVQPAHGRGGPPRSGGAYRIWRRHRWLRAAARAVSLPDPATFLSRRHRPGARGKPGGTGEISAFIVRKPVFPDLVRGLRQRRRAVSQIPRRLHRPRSRSCATWGSPAIGWCTT